MTMKHIVEKLMLEDERKQRQYQEYLDREIYGHDLASEPTKAPEEDES